MRLIGYLSLALSFFTNAVLADPEGSLATNHSFELTTITADLRGALEKTITIPHDAVYKSAKTYRTLPLVEVLRHWLGEDHRLSSEDWEIVFECADGYAPAATMKRAMSGHGYIAFADTDSPKGQSWVPRKKFDGSILVMAPYYLVWNHEDSTQASPGPWPHNLTTLRIAPSAARYERLIPKDKRHRDGFELFRKNCMVCHAIDGSGGTMGPELHSPRNITEYWKREMIPEFVMNPQAFRQTAKMPPMAHLGEGRIHKIVDYLEALNKEREEGK